MESPSVLGESENDYLKRYCKNIDITDIEFLSTCIFDCLNGGKERHGKKKWWRRESIELLAQFGDMDKSRVRYLMRTQQYYKFNIAIKRIAAELSVHIANRDLEFKPLERKEIVQKNGKIRDAGIEGMIQQFCDYAAVYGLSEMLRKKIGYSQFACIPKRGQFGGMNIMRKWLVNAKATRYCIQCDVEKCYDNIRHDVVMKYLRQCVKNDDLLYLVEALISTHGDGLLIGSFLSPYLCNFLMSFVWHYMYEQHSNEISHMATYIDDVILLGSNKRKLKQAFYALKKYIWECFGLRFKTSWRLYRVAFYDKYGRLRGQPIDFMGFRMTRFNVTVRKRVFLNIRRLVRKVERGNPKVKACRALASLYGWVKNTDCWRFWDEHKEAFETARKVISDYDTKSFRGKKFMYRRNVLCYN